MKKKLLTGGNSLNRRDKKVEFNRIRILIPIWLLITLIHSISAQQLPAINHYFLNTYIVNPAYAGNSGYTDVMALYRKQWVGVPGAPETSLLTADWGLKSEKAGLGLTFINDRTNIISRNTGYGSFSYRVNLSQFQRLYFGLSLGFVNTMIDFDKIRAKDPTESTLFQYPDQKILPDGNVGIAYQFKSFRAGFSVMQLFQNDAQFKDQYDAKALSYGLIRHFNLLMEYSYNINDRFRISPMVLLKSVQGMNPTGEACATVYYVKKYWLSVNYRLRDALGFTGGFILDNRFALSYSYELPSFSALNVISYGSHEVALKFRFVGASGRAKTGYEFIDNSINYVDEGVSEEEKAKNAKPLPKKGKK